MINFKNKDEVVPSAIIVASLAAIIVTLIYMVAVPKPSAANLSSVNVRKQRATEQQIETMKKRADEADGIMAARLSVGDSDTVTAHSLADLTRRALACKVQMSAFRPQKPTPLEGLIEVPITVQIAGSYPALLTFLTSMESPDGKLALRSVQIAAGGAGTTGVTATVSLSAYIIDTPPPTAAPRAGQSASSAPAPTPAAAGGNNG